MKSNDIIKSMKLGLAAIILALCYCLSSTLVAAERNAWSMEFRLVAHPDKEAVIVKKAKLSVRSELYEDKSLIAKWVPVIESKAPNFLDNSSFVTRKNTQGQIELLVLISENDVTEHNISELGTTLDRYGKLALEVRFEDADPPKLLKLTKDNIHRYTDYKWAGLQCSSDIEPNLWADCNNYG